MTGIDGQADDTKERTEEKAGLAFRRRLARRERTCTALLIEKERLQLQYVYADVPKPYYDRWKFESNEIFRQLVSLRQRRRRTGPGEG